MKTWALFILCICFVFLSPSADGAVLSVEKDGTGDFTIIQDAIDAAGDGDTIQIGAGRFNDYIYEAPWGNFRAWVHGDKSLTFIGAGTDQTIIGPEVYGDVNQDWGIFCDPGSENIRIEEIRFENLDRMAVVSSAEFFEIENCIFETCRVSCAPVGGQSATIQNCDFYNGRDSFSIQCSTPHALISNILVQNCMGGVSCQNGFTNDTLITDSIFDGDGVSWSAGIGFFNVGGSIVNCRFSNLTVAGVSLDNAKTVYLTDNIFENIRRTNEWLGQAIDLNVGESFFASGNIISSSDVGVYILRPFDQFTFNNNHIFRGDEATDLYVRTSDDWSFGDVHLDFTNNYWGTTDPEEISQWIFDGHDSDDVSIYVDFLPLADGPVHTESTTFDGLKAMFR